MHYLGSVVASNSQGEMISQRAVGMVMFGARLFSGREFCISNCVGFLPKRYFEHCHSTAFLSKCEHEDFGDYIL